MSSNDKRRRARIQGSWAPPQPRRSAAAGGQTKTEDASEVKHQSRTSFGQSIPEQRFQYVDQGQTKREQPPDIWIEHENEDYILSDEPSGISRIRYYPKFFDEQKLDNMYSTLKEKLPWEQRRDVKRNGESYLQPRLTAWFGDLPYSYSGVTLEAYSNWNPLVAEIKKKIEDKTKLHFNSVLGNLYRNEHDGVEWHADDEPSLGKNPTIASVTFGERRTFEMRKNPPPEEKGDYTYQQHVKIPLLPGSLLIMEGATQVDWQHRIPKEYHSKGPRINLTYRIIYPQ
ncbi:alpha-ketoglutarate-dependent dioxygenase alkB homolog 3-like [Ptychodera flava]|uniref:alpha-ketoglutarate-dependent dioxygenase alkB homolog 3-like n=1 Tax=Ptychodera flava TaxID=63121 RepID=UPI00396A95AE